MLGNVLFSAFNNWVQDKSEENEQAYYRLTAEQFKSRNDFNVLIREYCEVSGFYARVEGQRVTDNFFEKVQILYPDSLLINSTKAAQNISAVVKFDTEYHFDVTPTKRAKNGKKKYNKGDYLVSIIFESNNDAVTLTRPITQNEKNIMDAIESLAQHNSFITAAEVYRMINGGDHVKVTPEIIEETESSIDYMIGISAKVNYTQHMNLNGKKGEYTLKGPLLNLYKATRVVNGKTVSGYLYIAPSPVFMYAREVNQIVSIPSVMLNTRAAQRGGERANNIKFYLLLRLYTIKGQGPTISLDTLLNNIGEPNPSAQQLRTIRETIENLLELWSYGGTRTGKTAKNKEILEKSPIKGYTVNTIGKKITGYTLIPKAPELMQSKT